MKIKFTKHSTRYYIAERIIYSFLSFEYLTLCDCGLQKYFDLSDNPTEIIVELKKKKHKNSYFIEAKKIDGIFYLLITLSNRKIVKQYIHYNIYCLIKEYSNSCYVSVY